MSTEADPDVIWIDESGKDGQTSSVADMVAQAASSFMTDQFLQGYEYIDAYKMYYNRETGYYYQPETSLFYHASTKCFYRYDETTGSYVLHARADPGHKWSQRKFRKRIATLFGEDYVHSLDQTGVDVAETVMDLVDRCAFLAGDLKVDQRAGKRSYAMMDRRMSDEEPEVVWVDKTSSELVELVTLDDEDEESDDSDVICCEDDEEMRRREEEETSKNPPCIRVVEVNNSNALHVVTIMGATVGWGDGCDVRLAQSDHLAENHLRITYVTDEEDGEAFYKLECLSKKHPAWVGGNLLEKGSYCKLQHMDWLTIDNHCLVFHIHRGLNTCPQCEPGIQPKAAEPAESVHGAKRSGPRSTEAERRRNNRLLKKQLGLYGNDSPASKDYADRAKQRRSKYGSEPATAGADVGGIYANCAAAPVPGASLDSVQLRSVKAKESHEPVASTSKAIDASNVGFKLLKTMGWKEGCGLGKQQQGIVGPVISEIRVNRAGLGASSSSGGAGARPKVTMKLLNKRDEVLMKTKQRYEEASRRTE